MVPYHTAFRTKVAWVTNIMNAQVVKNYFLNNTFWRVIEGTDKNID